MIFNLIQTLTYSAELEGILKLVGIIDRKMSSYQSGMYVAGI